MTIIRLMRMVYAIRPANRGRQRRKNSSEASEAHTSREMRMSSAR